MADTETRRDADPRANLGRPRPPRRPRGPLGVRPRQESRAWIPRLSTNPSASRRTAGRAGRRPSRSRNRLPPPAAASSHSSSLSTRTRGRPAKAVPLIGFAEAGGGGYFDDAGFPVGKGWDEIPFPAVNDEHAYALEISGNFDGAGLSRRHHHPDLARRLDPPRRPRGGQDPRRRGDGEGAQAPHRQDGRASFGQSPSTATAACRCATSSGSRG